MAESSHDRLSVELVVARLVPRFRRLLVEAVDAALPALGLSDGGGGDRSRTSRATFAANEGQSGMGRRSCGRGSDEDAPADRMHHSG